MTNWTFYTTKLYLALSIIFFKPLTICYKNLRRPISHQKRSITAEMSQDISALVSIFCSGAEWSTRHFGTSAEMSWVRNVLGPKCPYTPSHLHLSLVWARAAGIDWVMSAINVTSCTIHVQTNYSYSFWWHYSNTNTLFRALFSTEVNTKRIFGTWKHP